MKKPKSYMPAGHLGTDSHAYDFLVQHGRKLARVQVKSCFTQRERGQTGFLISTHQRMYKGAALAYSQEDIDFIAAYVAPCQVWYVIPIEALEGGISIRVYPKLCPGGKTKRSGAFYETYREALHLLKEPEAIEASDTKQNATNREPADNNVERGIAPLITGR